MADGIDMSEMMKRAVQANAKFYKGWMDLTLEYVRSISDVLSGDPHNPQTTGEMDASAGALVMEGASGEAVRGAFLVTNDLGRQLSCEFVSSEFNDAAGTRVGVKPVFDPARVDLGPGEQRVINVTMAIDPKLSAGVGYAGEFSIKGMDGFAVPVVLRRADVVNDTPTGKDEGSSPGVPLTTGTKSGTVRKAASKRTGRKKR